MKSWEVTVTRTFVYTTIVDSVHAPDPLYCYVDDSEITSRKDEGVVRLIGESPRPQEVGE